MKRLFVILSVSVLVLTSAFLSSVEAAESQVYNGKKSLEFDVSATCLSYHTVKLEAGKTYALSAWVMHPKTGARVSMNILRWMGQWNGNSEAGLEIYANMENQSGHLYGDQALITDGTWQKAKATYTIPEASGDPMTGNNVSPGTSSKYAVGIDIRGAGKIYIDEVWLYDVTNPYVNLIEDGGFENSVVGPNKSSFNGEGWPGKNWVSNRWFPQYGFQTDGSGEISPFKIISVNTEVVAPLDPEHISPSPDASPSDEPDPTENASGGGGSASTGTSTTKSPGTGESGVSETIFTVFALISFLSMVIVCVINRKKQKTRV